MKYRLKKDLPFAEAGDVILNMDKKPIDKFMSGSYIKNRYSTDEYVFLGDKNELISEGWIEEAKPREWWANLYKSDVCPPTPTILYQSRQEADDGASLQHRKECIRLIEVLE